MKKSNIYIAGLAVAILLPSLSFSQIDRSIRPKAGKAPEINIKDSEVFTTKNGITVILSENHKLPRVSFSLSMGSDPRLEGPLAGLGSITGSLIMSGTDNRTKDQLDKETDYIGASLGASSSSVYMSCLTKHMDKGLDLMSDVLMYANFPQDEVDRIIKQNESGLISAKSDPSTMASNAESVANFPDRHPYGEIMTEESLAKINRNAIVAYYKSNFTPKGSYLVVVGDIDRITTEKVVDQYFGKWNGSDEFKQEYGTGTFNDGNRVIFIKKQGAVQSVINISFPMDIEPGHPDYIKLKVLNGILGSSGFGARLMQNLREDKAYTYGCYSRVNVNNNGSWFTAGGNFRNEVTDSAITEILFEIQRITDEYVTDEELELTKASMNGSFSRSLESPSTIARLALSIIRNDLPKDYYQTYLKKLEAITKDDVLEIAQKYFLPKKCNIVIVGSEEVLDKLEKFDADGEIEKLDAFGREVQDLKPTNASVEYVFNSYIASISPNYGGPKLLKKLKKIKSKSEVIEYSNSQFPGAITSTNVWISPNQNGTKMEMSGMTLQKQYFDGSTGGSSSMRGSEDMTQEEIDAALKSEGLFPELFYAKTGMECDMQGIETRNGIDYYLIKLNDGNSEIYEYYDVKTCLKVERKEIRSRDGETMESIINYGDYQEVDGFLFPMKQDISFGGMTLSGEVKEIKLNAKVNIDDYK